MLRIDLYSNLGDCISKCYHDISDIVARDGLNPVLSDDIKKCQHQLQYQKATQRLVDRAAHARLTEEMMQVKHAADEKHKSIDILQSLGDELKQKISDLSARREALLAKLKQIEEA